MTKRSPIRLTIAFASALLLFGLSACGHRQDLPPTSAPASGTKLLQIVEAEAAATRVPATLIMAVIAIESGGNQRAVNAAGTSFGLMQLTRATALAYGATDPFDPVANVAAGARLLRDLLMRYRGNVSLALAAYNLGPRAVDAARSVPERARAYVQRVLAAQANAMMIYPGISTPRPSGYVMPSPPVLPAD